VLVNNLMSSQDILKLKLHLLLFAFNISMLHVITIKNVDENAKERQQLWEECFTFLDTITYNLYMTRVYHVAQ
jgi:NADPH:quinone reductase-like Zn-dependent oxidoreductase